MKKKKNNDDNNNKCWNCRAGRDPIDHEIQPISRRHNGKSNSQPLVLSRLLSYPAFQLVVVEREETFQEGLGEVINNKDSYFIKQESKKR